MPCAEPYDLYGNKRDVINGRYFTPRRYAYFTGVWHDITDTAEVERIFGTDVWSRLPGAAAKQASMWSTTTGAAMSLLQLWQMQYEVITTGTLPDTPEKYAQGIPGTGHPLGWKFKAAQMYNPQDGTIYIVDQSSMGEFYNQLGWLAISWDTPKNKISDLVFDTPHAFRNKTPWTKGGYYWWEIEYRPNQVYENPTPTEFQLYFKEQRDLGRTPQDIYQSNPFMIKPLAYVAPPPQPTVTIAAVKPELPAPPQTYTWNIPFRSGLTQTQKDSITSMLTNRTNDGQTLNETDARNYAYAVNTANWGQFVGKRSRELSGNEIIGAVGSLTKAVFEAKTINPPPEKPAEQSVKPSVSEYPGIIIQKISDAAYAAAEALDTIKEHNYAQKDIFGKVGGFFLGLVADFDRSVAVALDDKQPAGSRLFNSFMAAITVPLGAEEALFKAFGSTALKGSPVITNFVNKIGLGHTLEKHVGKTMEWLTKRLADEGLDAVSSFIDEKTAKDFITEAIENNRAEIVDFFNV